MARRSEMDRNYQWDFSHIYPTKADWEAAFSACEASVSEIAAIKGTLGTSVEALKNGCDMLADLMERLEKVYIYAMLHKSADGGETEYQEMDQRSNALLVKISSAVAFINPEILEIPAETLNAYMADESLALYRHMLEDIARGRAHTLDSQREMMLAMLGDAANAPSDAYDMLTDVDMKLPEITDENGQKVQLTSGNFGVYRASASRAVREEAFKAMFGTYKKYENTMAALYGGSIKMNAFNARVRGYENVCRQALFSGNVPISVYDTLVEAINESMPVMRKYIELRKKAMKLDNIDMFDLYTPIVADVDVKVPFEDAKTLIKKALMPLGEKYQSLLDEAFANKWIDVYENDGKASGAFSCGVFGAHPYVLTNYTDELDDAYTLAHELGHAMHSYFSDHTQAFINHDYSIMVAEVASTVNEVLLSLYLLKTETEPARRAYVLNHFLEGFRTTVFRQTLFAEFERRTHAMYDEGTPLTAKAFGDLYHSLVAKYYDGVTVNDEIDSEWSYIPHFYRAFYVYQYATGFCSAVAIATHIIETGDASSYLKFLTLGGSDYPIDELKVAGVDLTNKETIFSAMKLFDKSIDELAEVLFK